MKKWIKYFLIFLVSLILISILWVLVYKWINPPISTMMIHRNIQNGKNIFNKPDNKWVDFGDISCNIIIAVISSEDNNFFNHNGFDWKSMRYADELNKKGKVIRGGSTISQQCAKNVFLWPHKQYIRKGLEVLFTFLIEKIWGKARILEVYLNVIETGNEIFGVESASLFYFKKRALKLNIDEAAYLAAILPNPRKWKAVSPGPYVVSRHNWIISNSTKLDPDITKRINEIKNDRK